MARWNTIRGPAANFELTAALTTIPGFEVTRPFDTGPILIAYNCQIRNTSGASARVGTSIQFDGALIIPLDCDADVPNTAYIKLHGIFLQPPAPGEHTIRLQAYGMAAPSDYIIADRSSLTIIEIPLWDQLDSLIIL